MLEQLGAKGRTTKREGDLPPEIKLAQVKVKKPFYVNNKQLKEKINVGEPLFQDLNHQ